MEAPWSEFKAFVQGRSLSIQYITLGGNYICKAFDGNFTVQCLLPIGVGDTDTIDFEINFKDAGNKKLSQKDSDGATIMRSKTTRTGWHYEPRSIDFVTSKYNSLYNRRHTGNTLYDGTEYGDAALFFFDASGASLVKGAEESSVDFQTRLDENCVRTQIDWQSTVEIDIIGATVSILNPPSGEDRAWAWVIVAPDIPLAYGGSVPFMAGGWNLRFFEKESTTFLDGRGVKAFLPDFVYNSNKMRVVIKHELGAKIECQFVVEKFNA
jgi:hypothetical protein